MKAIAYGSFFFNVVLFATYYAASKDALQRIDPVMFSGFELLVLLPVALGIIVVTWKKLNKDVLKRGVLLGVTLSAVFFSLAVALKYTTATETAFFPCLNGIFAAIVVWAVLRQRVSAWTWLAATLAIVGMVFMIGSPLHGVEWRGDVGAFLGAMIYTGYIFLVDALLVKQDLRNPVPLWPVLGVQLLTLGGMAAVFILLFGNWQMVHPELPKDLWAVFWVGMTVLLPTILSPFMQKYVDPTTIAFIYILEPLLSALVAFLYLGEVLPLHSYEGLGLVLGGVACQAVVGALPLYKPRSRSLLDTQQFTLRRRARTSLWSKSLRASGVFVLASALFLLVATFAGFGPLSLLSIQGLTNAQAATQQVVGHIFFESSGQISEQSRQGESDEIQVDLSHIPDSAPGKSYYAWLLGDLNQSDMSTVFLGRVTVKHGEVHFFYPGDAEHTNLLASTSRFLLTEEDASPLPVQPSPDVSTWRYYGVIPQMPNPADTLHHYSLLDHLRHLLSADPKLDAHGLPGGLDIWLFRVAEKVLEQASAVRDLVRNTDVGTIRRHLIRILDYLDSSAYVAADVPKGTPVLIDPRIAQVAVLEFDSQQQALPGYLYHIASHLVGLMDSPGVTYDQQQLGAQIVVALNNVRQWCEQVHQDAKKLVLMPDNQLLLPSSLSLFNDLVTQANNAYVGWLDPATNQLQAGVIQIHNDIQHVATMNVTPYRTQLCSPCVKEEKGGPYPPSIANLALREREGSADVLPS